MRSACKALHALHVAPGRPSGLEQRPGDLSERAGANGVHEHGEHVLIADHRLPEALEHRPGFLLVGPVKFGEAPELRLLLLLGRADEVELARHRVPFGIAERVHAYDGVGAVVLAVLVRERFLLDLAALVAGLHRSGPASAPG